MLECQPRHKRYVDDILIFFRTQDLFVFFKDFKNRCDLKRNLLSKRNSANTSNFSKY